MGELAAKDWDQPHRLPPRHPDGWEPGALYQAGRLVIVEDCGEADGPADLVGPDDVCAKWGYDPNEWEVERTEHRTYPIYDRDDDGNAVSVYGYYARAVFKPRPVHTLGRAEVDALLGQIKARRVKARPKPTGGAFVPIIADLQIGKSDGDGTAGTIERWQRALEVSVARAKAMKPDRIVACSLGDLVEGCSGHYAMQEWSVELTRRDQLRVLRKLLTEAVLAWAEIAPVEVVVVPGNHGENRKDGKAYTAFSDNDDVAVWESVAEAFALAGRDDVTFSLPYADLTRAVDIEGLAVGLVHGHQARTSGPPMQKLWKWWQAQAAADTPLGRCELLLVGHYHHEAVYSPTRGRTIIQAPALDGGSTWWRHQTGMESTPGMTMLEVRDGAVADYHVEKM